MPTPSSFFYYSQSRPLKRSAINFFPLRLFAVCDDSSSNLSKFMYFIMSCDREKFLIGIQSSISSTYSLPFFLPLAPRLSNFFFASAFQSKVFSSLSRSKATTLKIYFIEVNLNCVILCVEMEKDQKNLKSISFSQFISIKNIFREEK